MKEEIKNIHKILLIFILIISMSYMSINAQCELGDLGEPRSSYNMGSAQILANNNLIISVFVDTPSYQFGTDYKEAKRDLLTMACDYLEKEAEGYGQNCVFIYDFIENRDLFYHTKICIDPDESIEFEEYLDGKIALWTTKMASFSKLKEKYDADNVFMIVNFNTDGRSYAICYDGIDSERESLILFNSAKTATVAHEILHLYGAHDFYEDAEYTKEATDYIKKKYRNDIMLSVNQGRTVEREIGLLTAYHLGWVEKVTDVKKYPELLR